jgi:hypothetical protein
MTDKRRIVVMTPPPLTLGVILVREVHMKSPPLCSNRLSRRPIQGRDSIDLGGLEDAPWSGVFRASRGPETFHRALAGLRETPELCGTFVDNCANNRARLIQPAMLERLATANQPLERTAGLSSWPSKRKMAMRRPISDPSKPTLNPRSTRAAFIHLYSASR